jgi:hypothetical protein
LSAPHWLEAEVGGVIADGGAAGETPRRASIPYSLKYAFSEDWGIRASGEALVRAHGDGPTENGFGDTSLIVKRRFAVDDASALGLEAGALAPTARRSLRSGSGKTDYAVDGIYSADALGWHTDVNVLGTRFGARDAGASRWQTLGALALSHPLTERWQIAAEASGTRQHGQSATAQVLGALSYALRRDLVLDFGAAHGLNHATPTWQWFAGFTTLLGRVD